MTQNAQTIKPGESLPYVDGIAISDSEVQNETEHMRKELEAEREKYLRLAAEYQNYRRRTDQERNRLAEAGKGELLTQLLSIADELDLAIDSEHTEPEAVASGVKMIHRRFLHILGANDVVPFESKNNSFDPERHEAFDIVPAGDSEAGTVDKEMRRGYFWNGKLLRPALVVVRQ